MVGYLRANDEPDNRIISRAFHTLNDNNHGDHNCYSYHSLPSASEVKGRNEDEFEDRTDFERLHHNRTGIQRLSRAARRCGYSGANIPRRNRKRTQTPNREERLMGYAIAACIRCRATFRQWASRHGSLFFRILKHYERFHNRPMPKVSQMFGRAEKLLRLRDNPTLVHVGGEKER